MTARLFADHLKEYQRARTVIAPGAVLIRHGHGDVEQQRTFSTSMGQESTRLSIVWPSFEGGEAPPPAPARPPPPATSGGELGLVFKIAKRQGNAFDHISMGRTPNVDIVLPFGQVSKFHAFLLRDPSGHFSIADAGSTNGTWVGKKKLGVRQPELLNDGDLIRLGPYTFTYATAPGFETLLQKSARQRM